MNQVGRWPHMFVNRPLNEYNFKDRLHQHKRLEITPADCVSTIKMNSTYLEVVDKCYYWRGLIVAFGLCFLVITASGAVCGPLLAVKLFSQNPLLSLLSLVWTAFFWFSLIKVIQMLGRELCNLTHNPIRLNRKNRMVYAFSYYTNQVVAAPWDKIFFNIGGDTGNATSEKQLEGHILGDDGLTVADTILFARKSISTNDVLAYWEFIRRYMEEDPKELVPLVTRCQPLAERRETPSWGWKVLRSTDNVLSVVFMPLLFLFWLGRLAAVYTSRVPVWPEWVETECRVEAKDPFMRDSSQDPPLKKGEMLPYHNNM